MKKYTDDLYSLSHTKWSCRYHVVFALKYRRLKIGKILRELCEWKGVTILEAEVCVNRIHMLVMIPTKESISAFMDYLEGKSALIMLDRHVELKYKYGNRYF